MKLSARRIPSAMRMAMATLLTLVATSWAYLARADENPDLSIKTVSVRDQNGSADCVTLAVKLSVTVNNDSKTRQVPYEREVYVNGNSVDSKTDIVAREADDTFTSDLTLSPGPNRIIVIVRSREAPSDERQANNTRTIDLTCPGIPANTGVPDLAIKLDRLPTIENEGNLILRVTNVSPDVRASATSAGFVFQGRPGGGMDAPSVWPPEIGAVSGGAAKIDALSPGESTTIAIEIPVAHCADIHPLGQTIGFPGALLRATVTLGKTSSPSGVAETNETNNVVEVADPCQLYNANRRNGISHVVTVEKWPDQAHPRDIVLKVKNDGSETIPASTLNVWVFIGYEWGDPDRYPVPAIGLNDNVLVTHKMGMPCYHDILKLSSNLYRPDKNDNWDTNYPLENVTIPCQGL